MGAQRLRGLWNRVRDSLWFFPGALTLAAVVLAFTTIQLDVMGVLPTAPAGIWLFSGTAAGARGVLTAIASGFITVTGVVFSVTIVALQLASTQFTPRILRNFTSDRVNQLVLGVFIGTFTYALLVLRVVRGYDAGVTPPDAGEGGPGAPAVEPDAFVPHLSVTVAVVLAVVGIAFLIYFIHHAARSVQASVILDRVTRDALHTLERLLPDRVGAPVADTEPAGVVPATPGTIIDAHEAGYVQDVDTDRVLALVRERAITVRLDVAVGDFVLPGAGLATVWPAGDPEDAGLGDGIREAVVTGHERTTHLDLELGLIELSDIAVKALSPGINDPTTAILCVDRLCQVLLAHARRDPPALVRHAPDDGGVLVLPYRSFDRLVQTAFDEIRHYGLENPRFAGALVDRLGDLGMLLPRGHRTPIARQVAAIVRTAPDVIRDQADLRRLQEDARQALARIGGPPRTGPLD